MLWGAELMGDVTTGLPRARTRPPRFTLTPPAQRCQQPRPALLKRQSRTSTTERTPLPPLPPPLPPVPHQMRLLVLLCALNFLPIFMGETLQGDDGEGGGREGGRCS